MEGFNLTEFAKVAGIPGLLILYLYGRDRLLAASLRDLAEAIRERPAKT